VLVEVPLVPVEAAQVVVEGARPKSVERVAPNLAADSSAINAVREALEEEVALEEEMALEVVVVPEAEMLPVAVVEAEEDLLG